MAVRDGLMAFRNWFDVESWYPLGRVVGGTVYPGILVTAFVEHALLRLLGFPVPIKEISEITDGSPEHPSDRLRLRLLAADTQRHAGDGRLRRSALSAKGRRRNQDGFGSYD